MSSILGGGKKAAQASAQAAEQQMKLQREQLAIKRPSCNQSNLNLPSVPKLAYVLVSVAVSVC
jgi:hypothetical protein